MNLVTSKTILFASLITAMILSFSAMSFAEVKKDSTDSFKTGKLYIKDSSDHFMLQHHDEMNVLHKIVKDKDSSLFDRNNAEKRMDEIKKLSKQGPLIPEAKYDEIQVHRGILSNAMDELINIHDIKIVGIGTDFEDHAVNVDVERSGLTDEKIRDIEKILGEYIGDEADITISYADPFYFATCSQTGIAIAESLCKIKSAMQTLIASFVF